jgi:polar amino acid transport system substrate-binding protein
MRHYLKLLAFCSIIFLNSCDRKEITISSLSDLEGEKKIAVPTGTVADQFVLGRFPDAQIIYFNSVLDCALAVRDGKADAAAYDKPILKNIASKQEGITVLDELLIDDQYGFAVQPDNAYLKTAMDQTLAQLKQNGTYAQMMVRWFPEKGNPELMPVFNFDDTNGVLRFGTAAVTEPMSFVDENRNIAGFDIEFASHIAQQLGKKLEIVDMEFGALLPALISGKVDMVGAGMSITEERAKRVLFSESYYESGIAALVKSPAKEADSKTDDSQKIGVLMGSVYDKYASDNYPGTNILQFQTVPDMLTAVLSQKVDFAFFEDACLAEILNNDPRIGVLERNVFTVPIGAGFHKENSALRLQYNQFLQDIKSSGIYDDMSKRWFENNEKSMPSIDANATNGTLLVGLCSDLGFPYVGMKDGKLIGFEIEMAQCFASYLGKELVVSDMPFSSLIAALNSKKIDFIQSSVMITEERMKQIDFSDPYFETGGSIIMLKDNLPKTEEPMFSSVDDIANKRIGIFTGTVHDAFLAQNYPKAKRLLYDFTSDMILSLKTGKIDVIMMDLITAKIIMKHNPELGLLSDDIFNTPLGVGFRKDNPALTREFNQFISEIRANGIHNEMSERWFINDAEEAEMPQFNNPVSNKKLNVGVSVEDLPYVSYKNGEFVGFDIEMMRRFAEWGNYQLEIIMIDFPALIPALVSGKVQVITDGISISEERAKQIDFSEPYAEFRTGVLVARKNMAGYVEPDSEYVKTPFFTALANSFHNNIMLEKRYLLILDGLKVTFIISILAALLGTLIGSLLCFLRMSKNKATSTITSLFIDLIRGTPVLVFLMIIFYVVFASVNINPVIVAVVAFGINFGAYVSEMFRSSIESIDRGQREAGIASGFTKAQTFLHIIMPQALQRVLPVYKGEFISLVKMTSIVGYIAVQDLTKASDIIRSRTFDAFFPLIMAAVLYIIIAALFTWLLSRIEISVDPKRRKIKRTMEVKA